MARDSDAIELDIAGHPVRITSPGKVLFSERDETKLDLVNYYLSVTEPVMSAMGGRPVLMERYPHGAEGSSFFQKRVPDNAPDWLTTTIVSTPNGTTSRALVIADLAHVAWAVNLGCLGFHVWPARADDPDHADELRIDLDPTPGTDFEDARAVAHLVRALLDELGIVGFPKTTGKHGIHVYLRLAPRWDPYQVRSGGGRVRARARAPSSRRRDRRVVEGRTRPAHLRRLQPERAAQDGVRRVVRAAASGRAGVDARSPGTSSTRSTPTRRRSPACPARVAERGNPWADMDTSPQSLEPLLALHERDRANGLTDAPWPPVYPKMPGEPPRVAPSRAKKATKPPK